MHLLQTSVAEIFVSFPDCQKNLTGFVAKLSSFNTLFIRIKYIHFGTLCLLGCLVVDKEVRSILRVVFRLLHPDCAHFPILAEDLLDQLLRW